MQSMAIIQMIMKNTDMMKDMTETRTSLLVATKKSAVASMIAIAVSSASLLHQTQQTKHIPKRRSMIPVTSNAYLSCPLALSPKNTHIPPPPMNKIRRRARAVKARHLAHLLMRYMKRTERISPVIISKIHVFQVPAIS